MLENLKKSVAAGLEMAASTREKIEELSKELAEKSGLNTEGGKRILGDLAKKSKVAGKGLNAYIQATVEKSLRKMNVATMDDIARLEKKIAGLKASKTKKAPVKKAVKKIKKK